MIIREATLEDVPALVTMGQKFLTQSIYKDIIGNNPGQMTAIGYQLIISPQGVILVSETENTPTGMLGMICHEHFLSGEWVSGEVFWWVNPESRGEGLRLMRAAELWSLKQGAVKMLMIAPDERVGQLYSRLGYQIVETTYQKTL